MTQEPQGQGWWQASDGQWYPPETHPSRAQQPPAYGPPAYGSPPPQYAPQQYGPPIPPPKKGGGRGCVIALIIVLSIVTVIGIGVVALVSIAGRAFEDNIGSADCEFITDEQVATVLGPTEVFQLGGIASVAVPVLDARVLPEAETTCWGTADSGRIARFAEDPDGGAAGFDAEVAKARGTEQQRDDGITVTTDPYYSEPVRGLGDEAFCTTLDLTSAAGVLVRQGERLVYVSVTAATAEDPEAALDERTAGANCRDAQALARLVLTP